MIELIHSFCNHLYTLQDRLRLFSDRDFQSEGWFKTEFILYLSGALSRGEISDFDHEVWVNWNRIDFRITIGQVHHLIEAKHWLIGYQGDNYWRPIDYLNDPRNVLADVQKLLRVPAFERWLLIFVTQNPGQDEWNLFERAFRDRFAQVDLNVLTSPAEFPEYYFCGLWHIEPDQH